MNKEYNEAELLTPSGFDWFDYKKTNPFDFKATKFSLTNATWLGECSRIIYLEDITVIKNALKKAGLVKFKWFDKNGTQAFIAHNNDFMIVCFRGTEPSDIRDIKADLKALRVKDEFVGTVHEGFKEALDEVWNEMDLYIENNRGTGTVWLCGHSLGAALATLAASRMENNADGLYTIGSPRVGNKKFAKNLDRKITNYRFVNNNDIVTKVPFPIRFRHTNWEGLFDHEGNLYINPNLFKSFMKYLHQPKHEVVLRMLGFGRFVTAFNLVRSMKEHSAINYTRFLKKNLKGEL